MKILDLEQGSPAWEAYRDRPNARNASEASMMMGESPCLQRSEWVRLRALGLKQEINEYVIKYVFPKGHAAEKAARKKVEGQIVDDLYPVVAESDDGLLSASFDGLTMDNNRAWECKIFNPEKLKYVEQGQIPPADYWQCCQLMLISNAGSLIYSLANEQGESVDLVVTREYFQCNFNRLINGWEQAEKDVAEFELITNDEPEKGKAPKALPILSIQVTGGVAKSNLNEFRAMALSQIRSINKDLKTDEDFANAEEAARWCDKLKDSVAKAKDEILSQTRDISRVFEILDEIANEAVGVRKPLVKLIKTRKEEIRAEIRKEGIDAVAQAIREANKRLAPFSLPEIKTDFISAMKNKRLLSSLRDSVAGVVNNAKLDIAEWEARISQNAKSLNNIPAECTHLFTDRQKLAYLDQGVEQIVAARIAQYQAEKEAARIAEEQRLEAERERIRKEEAAKIEARIAAEKAREAAKAEQARAEAAQKKAEAEKIEAARREEVVRIKEAEARKVVVDRGDRCHLPGIRNPAVALNDQRPNEADKPALLKKFKVLTVRTVTRKAVQEWECEAFSEAAARAIIKADVPHEGRRYLQFLGEEESSEITITSITPIA